MPGRAGVHRMGLGGRTRELLAAVSHKSAECPSKKGAHGLSSWFLSLEYGYVICAMEGMGIAKMHIRAIAHHPFRAGLGLGAGTPIPPAWLDA